MDDSSLIACEYCASVYRYPTLAPGETANCARCGTLLARYSPLTISHWLALVVTAVIVFVVANVYPVAALSVQGMTRQATLLDAVIITGQQGHWAVALMTGLAGFVLPLLQLMLLLWILGPLALGRKLRGFVPLSRVLSRVQPWSMVPVFLLGVLVAVVKLAGLAKVSPGMGLYAFAALTLLLTGLGRLSSRTLWRYAETQAVVPVLTLSRVDNTPLLDCHVCGQVQAGANLVGTTHAPACVRCGTRVHYRKPNHLTRAWALWLAAAIFYIPANALPVMEVRSVFGSSAHTILGGVVELWAMGSWDIALIVFIASVAVPLIKLFSLMLLFVSEQRGSVANLRPRTRLYEMVEFIGQWSMLDVFVVILLAALADFQGLMQISAGWGAAAFGVVVILTMLSAISFDLRRSWDRVSQSDAEAAPIHSQRPWSIATVSPSID